jgi:hypothetical protein
MYAVLVIDFAGIPGTRDAIGKAAWKGVVMWGGYRGCLAVP